MGMSTAIQQRISILVIEDDLGDLGLIQANVRLAGMRRLGDQDPVVCAPTLALGVAAAAARKPDVVLLDLSLPDSTGVATVEAMRVVVPDVPIIVLTGQDDHQLAEAALKAGAQDYLVKGQFEHDALGRAIRHALVRQRLESRLRLFGAALNSVANGIVITDVNATIEWANPAFTRMTGFLLAEALGHKPNELLNSGKQDAQFYQRMWETILAGRVWSGELINRRKDGTLYDELLTISPVTDVNGRIQAFRRRQAGYFGTQGHRRACAAPGPSRPVDRPAKPCTVQRPPVSGHRAGAPRPRYPGTDVPRSGPLQTGQ
jgi:two-component system cell cycle response regulator